MPDITAHVGFDDSDGVFHRFPIFVYPPDAPCLFQAFHLFMHRHKLGQLQM